MGQNARANVSRCLFPDTERVGNDNYLNRMQDELNASADEFSRRWGINLDTGKELEDGDYEWTVDSRYWRVGHLKPKTESMKLMNQESPIPNVTQVNPPPIRKRPAEADLAKIEESGVNKKLRF